MYRGEATTLCETGLECVRGLRLLFREDAVQRGIHFGREGEYCTFVCNFPANESVNNAAVY